MSKLDIITLIIITIHSIFRAINPPKGKENRSVIGGFLITFIGDAVIYLFITFAIGYIAGSIAIPASVMNFIRRN